MEVATRSDLRALPCSAAGQVMGEHFSQDINVATGG